SSADAFHDHRRDARERVVGHVGRRFCCGPCRGYKLMPRALHLLDKACDRQVACHHRLEHLAATLQAGPALGALEIEKGRLGGGECVGLVLETAYGNAHQCTSVEKSCVEKAKLRPGAAANSARVYS